MLLDSASMYIQTGWEQLEGAARRLQSSDAENIASSDCLIRLIGAC